MGRGCLAWFRSHSLATPLCHFLRTRLGMKMCFGDDDFVYEGVFCRFGILTSTLII